MLSFGSVRYFLLALFAAHGISAFADPVSRTVGDVTIVVDRAANPPWVRVNGTDVGTIATLKKGTKLFHWSDDPDLTKKLGAMNPSQRWDYLHGLTANPVGMTFGGGVYVSNHPLDSHRYGSYLTVFELPRDFEVLMATDPLPTIASLVRNRSPSPGAVARIGATQEALMQHALFAIQYTPSWSVFYHADPLAIARPFDPVTDLYPIIERKGWIAMEIALEKAVSFAPRPGAPAVHKLGTGEPLTEAEAAEIDGMLRAAVEDGSLDLPLLTDGGAIAERVRARLRTLKWTVDGKWSDRAIRLLLGVGVPAAKLVPDPAIAGAGTRNVPRASESEFLSLTFQEPTTLETVDLRDLARRIAGGEKLATPEYAFALMHLRRSVRSEAELLKAAYHELFPNGNAAYRTGPLTTLFSGVSAAEKEALAANPNLSLKSVTARPDGLYDVRVEHPSPDRIEAAISAAFAKYRESEAAGLKELLAIMPFAEKNEEVLRVAILWRREKPFVLRSLTDLLLLGDEAARVQLRVGEVQHRVLTAAMKGAPGDPMSYDVPEFWKMVMNVDEIEGDPAAFIANAKAAAISGTLPGATTLDCANLLRSGSR